MDKVLFNIDMLDNILKYLKFRRILKLKLVCLKLNETIRRCPNFLGRAKARVIAHREYGLLVHTSGFPLCKTLRLEEGDEEFQEFLELISVGNPDLYPDNRSWDHVRALHIRYETLEDIDFQNYVLDSSIFQGLQELAFCRTVNKYETATHEVMKNLAWLSSVCTSLASFHVSDLSMPDIIGSTLTEYNETMTRFLELNLENLKSLTIGDLRIWKLPILANIKMPRLKICAITAKQETPNFRVFLNNHPLLTELSYDIYDFFNC